MVEMSIAVGRMSRRFKHAKLASAFHLDSAGNRPAHKKRSLGLAAQQRVCDRGWRVRKPRISMSGKVPPNHNSDEWEWSHSLLLILIMLYQESV